jgi:tetratricopeptide (TPR) repeat protein
MWLVWHCIHTGDQVDGLRHATQAVELADRLGSPFSRIWSWTFYGAAQYQRGAWDEAIEALERALMMSAEDRTAVEGTNWARIWLAGAHLGRGDDKRAAESARAALDGALSQGQRYSEAYARLMVARVMLAGDGASALEEVERELTTALALARKMEFRALEPLLHVELANLGQLRGDPRTEQEELATALEQFEEIGADGHAERVAGELALQG